MPCYIKALLDTSSAVKKTMFSLRLSVSAVLVTIVFMAHSACAVAVWGQCGGIGYSGSTVCDSGLTCVKLNDYYSQCQPGSATTTMTTTGTTTTTTSAPTGTGTPPAVGYNQVTNFGTNPTNVGIYTYVPSGLSANPGLVVALHYCTGSASAFYSGTQWKNLADQKKNFIVAYGDSPRSGKCWDVSTSATLTHDGGSDSLAIANLARYAISHWGVDANKVFVMGTSSGAMMTNVLLGAYPDIFKAGAASSGVAFGCFATTDGSMWNSACATGTLTKTGAQWGDLVRAAYPGYTGTRPPIQLYHGTSDETINYQNFNEEIKEWANVFGISETPTSTTSNDPSSGITHTTYGTGQLHGYSVAGGTHNIALHEDRIISFFGL